MTTLGLVNFVGFFNNVGHKTCGRYFPVGPRPPQRSYFNGMVAYTPSVPFAPVRLSHNLLPTFNWELFAFLHFSSDESVLCKVQTVGCEVQSDIQVHCSLCLDSGNALNVNLNRVNNCFWYVTSPKWQCKKAFFFLITMESLLLLATI